MKRFDVEKVIKYLEEHPDRVMFRSDITAMLKAGIVDEAEKVECNHPWTVKDKCIKCGRKIISVPAPAPDPIIEVWEKFKHLKDLSNDKNWLDMNNHIHIMFYEFWQAITKYAEGKGKK